jgi:hypothetical protein
MTLRRQLGYGDCGLLDTSAVRASVPGARVVGASGVGKCVIGARVTV